MLHMAEKVSMVDKPKLIDQFNEALETVFDEMHESGLSYWEMLKELPDWHKNLMMRADAEYYLKMKGGR